MGKIDTITKDYMRKPEILSDAFNMFLYKGEQVIKPEALRALDTTEIAIPYQEGKAGAATQKYRDVLKLWEAVTDDEAIYLIFGIENERYQNVHRDTVDVINATTRSNINYPKGEERVDMCTGLQELLSDKMTEGRQEGIKEGRMMVANQAEELRKQGKSADEILNIILSTTIQSV